MIGRAQYGLRRVGGISFAQVLFALGGKLQLVGGLHINANGQQIRNGTLVVQVVIKSAVIETEMQFHSLFNRLVQRGRHCNAPIVDINSVIALGSKPEVQNRILERLHLNRHVAAARSRGDRAAERIEEAL